MERAHHPPATGGSELLASFPVYALKHPGGVASMTLDRGYPDWLVLSARLLAQPSCGQVTIVQNRCLIMFPCGYVKILQPVAICTVIFVTPTNPFSYGSMLDLLAEQIHLPPLEV